MWHFLLDFKHHLQVCVGIHHHQTQLKIENSSHIYIMLHHWWHNFASFAIILSTCSSGINMFRTKLFSSISPTPVYFYRIQNQVKAQPTIQHDDGPSICFLIAGRTNWKTSIMEYEYAILLFAHNKWTSLALFSLSFQLIVETFKVKTTRITIIIAYHPQ